MVESHGNVTSESSEREETGGAVLQQFGGACQLLCFSPQGQLIFKLPNVGINSNTVLFRNKASQGNPDENPADPEAGAFANKVLEYNLYR